MNRFLLIVSAILSPFLFPWQAALLVVAAASFFLPPVALLAGVLTDALYWTSGPFPYATLLGVLLTAVAYLVQHFVRTRIMGA